MWVAHAFIHACWCSSNTSLHLREVPQYLMSFWHHCRILYLCLIVVVQWQGWSPSMMVRNQLGKFSWNSNRLCKFAICSMFVQFWSHSTCCSPIVNTDYLSLIFSKNKNVISSPTCIIIPLHAKLVTKVVDPTTTPSHHSRLCHEFLPFVDVEMKEGIKHVSDREEGMEENNCSDGASMHGSTLTTFNVLMTLWTLI